MFKFSRGGAVLAPVLLAILTCCGPKRVMVNGIEMDYAQGAATVFQEGQAAQQAGDLPTARQRFQQVVDTFSEAPEVPNALWALGQLGLKEGGCAAARGSLEKLVERYPGHTYGISAAKRLAECENSPAATDAVQVAYRARFDQAASAEEKRKVATEAAETAQKSGDAASAARWLLIAFDAEADPSKKAALQGQVTEAIDRMPFTGVRELLESRSDAGFPRDLLTYKLARIQYHVRDYANASETAKQYLASWPSGTYAADAKDLVARIEARDRVDPKVIGVALPLSGKLRSYGELGMQAIRLALRIQGDALANDRVRLVVRDTQGSAAGAAQAVEELALKEGVIAILGPIFSAETESAAYQAQQLGVPLLTISASDLAAEVGPYIFRNGMSKRAEIAALVRYAMEVEGMKRFAVLYPRHPYGEELLDLFWDEVEARRGEIRGVEGFAIDDTTFTDEVKRLVARDIADRGDYRRAVEECNSQPDNYRKQKCKENAAKNIKPLIDFDALFIPAYPEPISMISAALAFEDIIVERDPSRLRRIEKTLGRSVKPVTLLGASGWNSDKVPERSGRNVENAIFTDGFFARAEDKESAEFVSEYQKRYQRTPSLYPEALMFDSARIVAGVLATQQPRTRSEMQQALRAVHDFPGVSGKTSFARGNDADKPVKILTIKNQNIVEIPPVVPVPPAVP